MSGQKCDVRYDHLVFAAALNNPSFLEQAELTADGFQGEIEKVCHFSPGKGQPKANRHRIDPVSARFRMLCQEQQEAGHPPIGRASPKREKPVLASF